MNYLFPIHAVEGIPWLRLVVPGHIEKPESPLVQYEYMRGASKRLFSSVIDAPCLAPEAAVGEVL